MMTDPIADMLTRIRNAVRVEKPSVDMPLSIEKRGVADVLKREGYIWDWETVEAKPVSVLRLHLKYGPNGENVVNEIKRVSKPGCRVYAATDELKPVLNGLGIRIPKPFSTGFRSSIAAYTRHPGLLTRLMLLTTFSPLGPYFK